MIAPTYKTNNMIKMILSNRRKRSIRRRRITPSNHNVPSNSVRTRNSRPIVHRNIDGILTKLSPKDTYWYLSYIVSPQLSNPKFNYKFRRRFRMPHSSFLWLLDKVTTHPLFKRWTHNINYYMNPTELLLLGSLRYMGRGLCFDDLEEATCISEEVHRVFFHQFILFGDSSLYPQFVQYPKNAEQASTHMKEFTIAGMNGGVGSMDACHVIMEKCAHRLKQNHLGGKSKQTCRSFNLTSNHRKKFFILPVGIQQDGTTKQLY